jgi:hypothetical protein
MIIARWNVEILKTNIVVLNFKKSERIYHTMQRNTIE